MRSSLGLLLFMCLGLGTAIGVLLKQIPEFIGFGICLAALIEFGIKGSLTKEDDL